MLYANFTCGAYRPRTMDLSFSLRVRKRRRRDLSAAPDLPLLFARLAAAQAGSVTAIAQMRLNANERDVGFIARRVALFSGNPCPPVDPACASFAESTPRADPSTKMKPPFTLALQRSFKPGDLDAGAANEQPGALPPARGFP